MKILRRTNGIDIKAKNSGLHGSCIVQFRDPVTDKVVDEERHENFFTRALSSVLNECPFGLNNPALFGLINNGTYSSDGVAKLGSIYEWLLGGILVFPNSLGNDTDELYAPFTNYPVAIGSMESYTHRSNKQGNFNSAESGQASNGFRYVYDWGTSQGTGTIASIALSHRRCYEYFNDGQIPFFPRTNVQNYDYPSGYISDFFSERGHITPIVCCDDGIVTTAYDISNEKKKIRFYRVRPYDIQLLAATGYGIPNYLPDGVTRPFSFVWEADLSSVFTGNTNIGYQFENGHLYGWQKNAEGSNAITIADIDITNGSVISSNSYTFTAPDSTTSQYHFAIKNGFLYMPSKVAGKIYKCELANTTHVDEIACNAVAYDNCWATDGSDFIYGQNFVINNGITNDMIFTSANYNCGRGGFEASNRNIIYEHGVWQVIGTPTYGRMGAQIKTPYLATKNNLDSPKNKSADKTMKIIYTVTQA